MSQQKVWFMASRGFGPVWTEAVLKRGDKVAASARNPKALTAFFEVYGGAVLPLELDVTDRDAGCSRGSSAFRASRCDSKQPNTCGCWPMAKEDTGFELVICEDATAPNIKAQDKLRLLN
jgi:hypothetical protein